MARLARCPERRLKAFRARHLHPPQRSRAYRRCPCRHRGDLRCRALPVRLQFSDRKALDQLSRPRRRLPHGCGAASRRAARRHFQQQPPCAFIGLGLRRTRSAMTNRESGRETRCRWKSRSWTMAISSWNRAFWCSGRDCGRTRRVLTLGFLILGGPYPVVVDTGYRSNQIMETLGMRGLQFHENMIENQLARHGVRMGDVRFVCHTHLHIDHAGKDDLFPMNTTVVRQSPGARIFRLRPDASAISGARHQASDRPPAHQERAALPRSRDHRAGRTDAGRLLRCRQRPYRGLDEHPSFIPPTASPPSAAT